MNLRSEKGPSEILEHPVDKFINRGVKFIVSFLKEELIWSVEQLEWVAIKFDTNINDILPAGKLDGRLPNGIRKICCTDNPKEHGIKCGFQNYDDFHKSLNPDHISNLKLYFDPNNQHSLEVFSKFMMSPLNFDGYQFPPKPNTYQKNKYK